MESAAFEARVRAMEQFATRHPKAYRWRVLAWAAAGYVFLALTVIALLSLVALIVAGIAYLKYLALKLLIIVVPVLWAVLRSAWVRFQPPKGLAISRGQAPELFVLLDDIRARLDTPRIHAVLLTDELNAGIVQHPRLGLLGWHRNYLLVGLPLLKGLSVEQFKAVLAHELGHLSRGHGRIGNGIYRLRLIWARLLAQLRGKAGIVAVPIARFFVWYAPRFDATSFPLARANEYEADAASVRLTSAAVTAQALTGVHMIDHFLRRKYWPNLFAAVREIPEPPIAAMSEFSGDALRLVPEGERAAWLTQSLAQETSLADTHPSLSDRLMAIGQPAQFEPPIAGAAAIELLGAQREAVERRVDEAWRGAVGASWRRAYEEACEGRARLAELRTDPDKAFETPEAAAEFAVLEGTVGEGFSRALALRREAVARFPDSMPLKFSLAQQLLLAGEPEGVAMMEDWAQKMSLLGGHLQG